MAYVFPYVMTSYSLRQLLQLLSTAGADVEIMYEIFSCLKSFGKRLFYCGATSPQKEETMFTAHAVDATPSLVIV